MAAYLLVGLFCARAKNFMIPEFVRGKGTLPYSYPNGTYWERKGKRPTVCALVAVFWPLWLFLRAFLWGLRLLLRALNPLGTWFFTNPAVRRAEERQKRIDEAYAAAINLYREAHGDQDLIRYAKLQLEFARTMGKRSDESQNRREIRGLDGERVS